MALPRKYSGFNLYSAVPVPTQLSAVLVGRVGFEPTQVKPPVLQTGAALQLDRLPKYNALSNIHPTSILTAYRRR